MKQSITIIAEVNRKELYKGCVHVTKLDNFLEGFTDIPDNSNEGVT